MTTLVQTNTVSLTPAAAEVIRDLFKQRNLNSGYALRIFISGQGCSGYHFGLGFDDKPGETDTTIESQGIKVLIDEVSLQCLNGTTLDYIDDERGKGFLVDNPNTPPACSCEGGSCGPAMNE